MRRGLVRLKTVQVAGTCECGGEFPGSVKCRDFLGWLRICWFLKKGFVPGR
jgi:hypothetical protein